MAFSKWANYIGKKTRQIGENVVFYILSKETRKHLPEKTDLNEWLQKNENKKEKKKLVRFWKIVCECLRKLAPVDWLLKNRFGKERRGVLLIKYVRSLDQSASFAIFR